ncbi:MAG: SIMPL domain-containing protein [Acidimicrobiales bacterium]
MSVDHESHPTTTHPTRNVGVAVVVIIVALALVGAGLAWGRSGAKSGTITVTGSGSVMGTPDTVTVQLGVSTTASSATLALSENNSRTNRLIASLKSHGIKPKDLQTSGLNIYQNTNQAGQVTGFTVTDDLTVTIHRVSRAGAAIDAAANAVGNGIELNGVTLSISNDSTLLAAARAKAMHNARRAASQISAAAGTHLGGVVTIIDEENQNSYVFPMFAQATAVANLKSVPIEAGTQAVSVQVKVIFSL